MNLASKLSARAPREYLSAPSFAHPGRILGGQIRSHGLAPVRRHRRRRGRRRLPAVADRGHARHADRHQVDTGVEARTLWAAGCRGGDLVVENLLLS